MYDCHYDLLTYIYMNKHNLNEVKEHCNKIFNENIEDISKKYNIDKVKNKKYII